MLNKQKGIENTPRNRLHNALLTLNFFRTNENSSREALDNGLKKTSGLNQPLYFKDVLTSQWKPGDVLHWGRGFALVSIGEEKLWIPPKLIKIPFEKEKPTETEK